MNRIPKTKRIKKNQIAAVFPHDPGKADAVRKKAVEWILKLQEKAKR